jgi:hypothetical protein
LNCGSQAVELLHADPVITGELGGWELGDGFFLGKNGRSEEDEKEHPAHAKLDGAENPW